MGKSVNYLSTRRQGSAVRISALPLFSKPNSDAIENCDGDGLVKTEDGSTTNRGREDAGAATREGRTPAGESGMDTRKALVHQIGSFQRPLNG